MQDSITESKTLSYILLKLFITSNNVDLESYFFLPLSSINMLPHQQNTINNMQFILFMVFC